MKNLYTKGAVVVSIVASTIVAWAAAAAAQTTSVSDAITAGADSISDQVIAVLPAIIGGSAVLFAAFLGIKALFNLFKRAVA